MLFQEELLGNGEMRQKSGHIPLEFKVVLAGRQGPPAAPPATESTSSTASLPRLHAHPPAHLSIRPIYCPPSSLSEGENTALCKGKCGKLLSMSPSPKMNSCCSSHPFTLSRKRTTQNLNRPAHTCACLCVFVCHVYPKQYILQSCGCYTFYKVYHTAYDTVVNTAFELFSLCCMQI